MAKNLLKTMLKAQKRTPGRVNTKDLIEKVESGYLADNHDGYKQKKSFSPSTLVYGHGACSRYWFFAFHGAEFTDSVTPQQVANMRNGSLSHERIQKAVSDAGILVSQEKKILYSNPPIFGFCDLEIEWDECIIPIEIKTANEMAFVKRKESGTAAVYHVAQLLIYMYILNYDMGIILYENKNTHELLAIPVEVDEDYKAWIEKTFHWCREVKAASDDNKLPKKNYRSNSKVCKSCPLSDRCNENLAEWDIEIPNLEPLV